MLSNLTSADSFLPEFESFPGWLRVPFLIISIIESIIGIIGNLLVILIILFISKSTYPQLSHNCFIINLALSDFVLCLFTMPLNIYRSLKIYMTFPPAFCKLADSFPAINICVSSLTIMTISIYRYLLVCYPYKKIIGKFSTCIIMISIWLLAIGAASPLFIYSRSVPVYDESLIDSIVKVICGPTENNISCQLDTDHIYKHLHVCHESWPKYGHLHLLYTIFMLFLQFILPIFVICITYYQVMIKLRERFRYRFLMKRNNITSLRHEVRRQRRNNILLLLIVSLYAISWLPFNISYIFFTYTHRYGPSDKNSSFRDEKSNELSQYVPLRFLVCMISAITNPFLYSYFNETFKNDLQRILSFCRLKMNRGMNQISFDRNDCSTKKIKSNVKNFERRSSYCRPSDIFNGDFISRTSHEPSTRLTVISTNQFSSAI